MIFVCRDRTGIVNGRLDRCLAESESVPNVPRNRGAGRVPRDVSERVGVGGATLHLAVCGPRGEGEVRDAHNTEAHEYQQGHQ